MLSRRLLPHSPQLHSFLVCRACAAQRPLAPTALRFFTPSSKLQLKVKGRKGSKTLPSSEENLSGVRAREKKGSKKPASNEGEKEKKRSKKLASKGEDLLSEGEKPSKGKKSSKEAKLSEGEKPSKGKKSSKEAKLSEAEKPSKEAKPSKGKKPALKIYRVASEDGYKKEHGDGRKKEQVDGKRKERVDRTNSQFEPMSLKEALLANGTKKESLDIQVLEPAELDFSAVDVEIPPVPRLSYGLDRVLFNPGIYRLKDPNSRVYNFDPYLEKIMSVRDFDFDALSEYKTSSRDEELQAMNRRLGTKFTGSTSSMSGILQHFHFLISGFRELNHSMLSKGFPAPPPRFSKITFGPDAIFLRYRDGRYAIDADKSYDTPNIMSWLGHSLEKLLTVDRDEFERFRRSSPEQAPKEDDSSRCYHYSTLGNILMRSQLDAHDPRLPGTGIFDLKTRAVVSIRMDHEDFELGSGYEIRHDRGEWESFEREFCDMTRATMLKYSLQVRMGRMNGIFVAYHNIERLFGFQYLSRSNMDEVLHGQTDTCLGDQEFKISVSLLDELLQKATERFPETSLRMHFRARQGKTPFMYIFAEPVTEDQADELQTRNQEIQKAFARDIVGINREDPEVQKEWHDIQDSVDTEVDQDESRGQVEEADVTEDDEVTLVNNDDTVDDDHVGEISEENPEETSEESSEETEEQTSEEVSEETEEQTAEDTPEKTAETIAEQESAETANGPLIGWTLAVRSKVNGFYVERPVNLKPDDKWTVEYHMKEIAPTTVWKLYNQEKEDREKLLGGTREEKGARLETYLRLIHKFSKRGREWRQQQDTVDDQLQKEIFRPMGPGSNVEER